MVGSVSAALSQEVFRRWASSFAQATSIDCTDAQGRTALMIAAINGNLNILEQLLRLGANIQVISQQECTALDYTVIHQQQTCAAALLREGACLNMRTEQELMKLSQFSSCGQSVTGFICFQGARYKGFRAIASSSVNLGSYTDRFAVLSYCGRLFHCNANFKTYDPQAVQLRNRTIMSYNDVLSIVEKDAAGDSVEGNTVRIRCNSRSQAVALLQELHNAQNLSLPQSNTSLLREQVQNFLLTVDLGQLPRSMQPISTSAGSKPAVVCPLAVKEEAKDQPNMPEAALPVLEPQRLLECDLPISNHSGQKLLQLMGSVGQQETSVIVLTQQLQQIQEVLEADVVTTATFLDSCRDADATLERIADTIAKCRQDVATAKVQLQAAVVQQGQQVPLNLAMQKKSAEQGIQDLLKEARCAIQHKLQLYVQHQQYKNANPNRLKLAQQKLACKSMPSSSAACLPTPAVAEILQHNQSQLQASLALSAAFVKTQEARDQLQHCLAEESRLLQSLEGPVRQGLAQSRQLVQQIADSEAKETPRRELRYTEMMLRDNELQQNMHTLLIQRKAHARAAISGLSAQQEQYRDLSKQIVRSTAMREELLIDAKQTEAERVSQKLTELSAARAALSSVMESQAQLLASPDLMLDHPELKWETAAATTTAPLLGVAQKLFAGDRKLADFKVISHPAATVIEAEDQVGRVWALKRIQGDRPSVREAERMFKLRDHPLVVHLESVFLDGQAIYLQMPFYKHGNLRTWVEQIKAAVQSTGTFPAMQKAAVRSTMRQLAQAIAYTHQHGVTHRDIKPENVLLQDNGNIALCDFGISKDIINGAYESTVHLAGAAGTLAYCAPEAGDDTWKKCPTAVDLWAFGIMLLELVSGKLFSWVGDKIAYQPNRLERAQTLSKGHLPSDDVWFAGAWQLIEQLLDRDPHNRPSMDTVLLSPFFTSDRFVASPVALDRKFRVLTAHLDSIRQRADRTPAHLIRVQSEQTVMADMLQVFADQHLPLHKVFHVQWGPNAVRKPLQEVMDIFLLQLATDTSPTALFQQCDQPIQLSRSYLPPAHAQLSDMLSQQYQACGRILAKCVLEGIHVPITFSAALHSMLVNTAGLSSHADECIAMLADFDPQEAQRLRQTLAARHGDGTELLLTVGGVLGADDETMLTDHNKEDVACRKVRKCLVEDRHAALDAIRIGFCSLDIADDLEGLSGTELASLFFGEQYLDVDRLVASIQSEAGQDNAEVRAWLERFIRSLSEHSIRIFLARSTNKLSLPQPGLYITMETGSESSQPVFMPEASHMQLPKCPSYEAFASRLGIALRLGEYMFRTDAQNEQRLSKEEEQAVIRAMGGEVRAGGYYRCTCGYIYAVGECGGPMQQAACPRCGSVIGGLQHRLAAGNEHVGFDGAHRAAWPQ